MVRLDRSRHEMTWTQNEHTTYREDEFDTAPQQTSWVWCPLGKHIDRGVESLQLTEAEADTSSNLAIRVSFLPFIDFIDYIFRSSRYHDTLHIFFR